MKLHLIRLAKAQGEARFPGIGHFRSYVLKEPKEVAGAYMYLLLEGELVIDLPDKSYLHLEPGEAAYLPGPHRLVPVGESVIGEWKISR